MSILLAVHNAEREIESKIRNCLELEYPHGKLQVVIVSDASTDATPEILARWAAKITFKCLRERKGKNHALNRGLELCTSDLIFFTDVGASFERSSIRKLARHFSDSSIGCASSFIRTNVSDTAGSKRWKSGEDLQLGFDLRLRLWESEVYSTVNAVGAGFLVRRELVPNFPSYHANDFGCALNVVNSGYRVIVDPNAGAHMAFTTSRDGELQRKVRTALRGMWTLVENLSLRLLTRPFLLWQIVSRKAARWLFGYFYATAIVFGLLTPILAARTISSLMLFAVGIGFIASIRPSLTEMKVFRYCSFLWIAIEGSLVAVGLFALRKKYSIWSPTNRDVLEPVKSMDGDRAAG
ncbi:MAG: glycosyltransferase [Bdellovibrionales bacterium]|nr:glycosyltransferase [Bdellovibrionales bacterium]